MKTTFKNYIAAGVTVTVHSCAKCGRFPKVIQEGPILIMHMFHKRGCPVPRTKPI